MENYKITFDPTYKLYNMYKVNLHLKNASIIEELELIYTHKKLYRLHEKLAELTGWGVEFEVQSIRYFKSID